MKLKTTTKFSAILTKLINFYFIGGPPVFSTDNFCAGLLPQSLHLVRDNDYINIFIIKFGLISFN